VKINPETIFDVLKELKISAEEANKAITKMERLEKAANAEKPKEPKPKKQFLVLLYTDAKGEIGSDPVASVVQMPEEANHNTLLEMIGNAAEEFHSTRKGKKHRVKTVGEALEGVGSKFFKTYGVVVKTKTPVMAVRTDNTLPASKE